MATCELKCHSDPKLTNSVDISNSLVIMNIHRSLWLSIYLKKLWSNVSSLNWVSVQEKRTEKGKNVHWTSPSKLPVTSMTQSDDAYLLDLRGTPAAVSKPSRHQSGSPALFKSWSSFKTSFNLYLAKVFCLLLSQDAVAMLPYYITSPMSVTKCYWTCFACPSCVLWIEDSRG